MSKIHFSSCWRKTSDFVRREGEPIAPDPAFKGSQGWLKQEIPAELGFGSAAQKARLTTLQAHWQTRVSVPGDHRRASDSKSSELSFTTRVAKASKEECEEQVSHHLENLVRLVTAAKRKELGDIVWFCYNEQDEPKTNREPIAPFLAAPAWLSRSQVPDGSSRRCQR